MHDGDNLEDDYIPDPDLIVASEEDEAHGSEEDDEHEEFHGLEDSEVNLGGVEAKDKSISKKRKRREKEKEKKVKAAGQEAIEAPSVANQIPSDVATYLSVQQAKVFPKLSVLELEELRIPDSCIADTASYTGPRMLDHLGDFITKSLPQLMVRLSQKPRANGAPTLIFVAGAALRVADVTRVLRKHRGEKGGEVAKLFAKHFKLQEHITYLTRNKVGVAVGTPARLGQLLETGALALTALTHIIIDVTHRDSKKRSMIDIPETRNEVFRGVLGDANIRAGFQSGKLQLILF